MTPEVLIKLEGAFAIDANATEACLFAGISQETFYNYLEKHPEFRERMEQLKVRPILKARKAIVDDLGNVDTARWFVEKKLPKEFGSSTNVVVPVQINITEDREKYA